MILCPCVKCINQLLKTREEVFEDLILNGFLRSYTIWSFHREASTSNTDPDVHNVVCDEGDRFDSTQNMLNELWGRDALEATENRATGEPVMGQNIEAEKFKRLMEDAKQELYPRCNKFTKLSFLIQLYHIKCLCNLSDKAFSMLLDLLRETLPEQNTLPNSLYEAKEIIKELGLNYVKIDACSNDYTLYWKESATATSCKICGTSRYEKRENKGKKIPVKILRHFPLIPRLQRLYMSTKISSSMRWHHEQRVDDQRLRHPTDSKEWKDFDMRYPYFSKDPRNVRLGLASDGFNPFKTMTLTHSMWPIMVVPYNLPPWMCMKQPFVILTLLIPDPKQPGNNMDIYLQPLIEELKELWHNGVETYDVYKKETFKLHACLLWTINDFPAYANLSGWSTKGALACPCCNKDTSSRWLKYGGKHCYLGHRRFLPSDHRFRRDRRTFDGHEEHKGQPEPLSGYEVLEQLEGVQFPPFGRDDDGKKGRKRKRSLKQPDLPLNWKKKSIFFDLPYWKDLIVHHNLDVMHIEKNVCDSIIGTLLDLKDKTKDTMNACLDLKDMHIRPDLHPQIIEGKNKVFIPSACYSLSTKDKDVFCTLINSVKVPDSYASNIARCVQVKERKISGMKSHDCHILIQQILPVALRNILPKNVRSILMELCQYFRDICDKVGKEDDFKKLEESIVVTLCNLERIFPPGFFNIMVYLIIHLAFGVRMAGPVQYRWMYPIERFLKQLKNYMRNRSHPEGSIAEGYLANECLIFLSRYFEGVETIFNRPASNTGSIEVEDSLCLIPSYGKPLGKCEMIRLDMMERIQAHRYILMNYDGIKRYRAQHYEKIMRDLGRRAEPCKVKDSHARKFPKWFNEHIMKLCRSGVEVLEHIRLLASGPKFEARSYTGYLINEIMFHTKARESNRKTQNSGCDWANSEKRLMKDEHGFTLVNFNHLMDTGQNELDDPFIFASQAEQVFYVPDPLKPDWHVVIKTKVSAKKNMHAGRNSVPRREELHTQPVVVEQQSNV
ncbi:uncharacterized protein LOC122066739 [Macadamia integrifolia]|uniref:uncharacterized protein LOC122066739 n=1 Tax=Macadamia integrifolia TaxID=60698 RepID=UPI001C4ED10B|nr:uncharacterized protein LOC122066739 [Macadamia integrifolia]